MIFVMGPEGRIAASSELRVSPPTMGKNGLTGAPVKIAGMYRVSRGGGNGYYAAAFNARGVAVESRGFYARVLPADAEEGLAKLDEQIEATQKQLNELHAERQAYLAANIVRGEKISKKHVPTVKEGTPK